MTKKQYTRSNNRNIEERNAKTVANLIYKIPK